MSMKAGSEHLELIGKHAWDVVEDEIVRSKTYNLPAGIFSEV